MNDDDKKLQQMGSLLSRMTKESDKSEIKFTSSQVRGMVEIVIPKMIREMPGMPPGMVCQIDRHDDGWTVEIRLPEGWHTL